jgi:hypothetical protein
LQEIADAAHDVLTELAATAKWAMDNKDWLLPLVAGLSAIGGAAKTIAGITTAIKAANVAMAAFNATTLLNPLVLAGASIAAILATPSSGVQDYYANPTAPVKQVPNAPVIKGVPKANTLEASLGKQNVTNVTINTPRVNAQDVVNIINKAQKTGYTGQITIPRSK